MIFCLIALFGKSQEVNGIITYSDDQFKVLKVWGTHEERGYAVGYLLADGVDDLFENYLMPAFGDIYDLARILMSTNAHIAIDSIYIYEAMGMADGINASGQMSMEVDHIDVLLANSFLDLQNFSTKDLGLENGCSSLISWGDATAGTELDGKAVMSRHLDWDDQPVIIRNQVMIIHFPEEEDEQPWALVGFAGQISVLSGFNSSGVGVMQHMLSDEYSSGSISQGYEPVWFSMRKAIEMNDYNGDGDNNCLDINAVINENTNGYADSYIVTGIAPSTHEDNDKIATIIELAPSEPYITIRNTEYEDGIPSDNLYAANWTIARNDMLHYCTRYDGIMDNIGTGTLIGKHENWNLMLQYSSACIAGGFGNIQFMQYVPEENYFKLAYHQIGGPQACASLPVEYDTNELFEVPTIIDKPSNNKKLKAYPNPAINELRFYIPGNVKQDTFSIVNQAGVEVKIGEAFAGENSVDISDLSSGSYFIIFNNSGLRTRFIK
jgi:hypothetical protein